MRDHSPVPAVDCGKSVRTGLLALQSRQAMIRGVQTRLDQYSRKTWVCFFFIDCFTPLVRLWCQG
jgi:hypothetical protein